MISPFIVNFLAFIFIPIGVFFLFGMLIFYHMRRYGIEGDSTKKTATLFSLLLSLISITIIIIFLSIDWNKVSIEDFIEKSNIILYDEDYD